MRMLRLGMQVAVICMLVAGVGTAAGEDYPNKPIRIVTGLPGGGNDFSSRLIAQGLTGPLGQPIIVDNRPGTVIPTTVVFKAPADGYTLLVAGTTFMLTHLL